MLDALRKRRQGGGEGGNVTKRSKVDAVKSPFWNDVVAEASNRLWKPTKSEIVQTKSLASTPKSIASPSWYSGTITSHSSLVDWKTDETMTDTTTRVMRTRKIKLDVSAEQKALLMQWFGAARWTYNKCVESVQVKKELSKATKSALRQRWMNSDVLKNGEFKWALDVPYEIRDTGVLDFVAARKAEFSKKRKAGESGAQHTNAKYQFRSKKDPNGESIHIRSRVWKDGVICPRMWGNLPRLKSFSEALPYKLTHDAKLHRTVLNEFYLCVTYQVEVRPKAGNDNQVVRVASLDPGVRTFNTVYDPTRRVCVSVGTKDISRIYRLCLVIDDLKSEMTKVTARKRRDLNKKAHRIRKKIKNLVHEVHCKLVCFLCENYDEILISKFQVKNMVEKGKRKIGKRTVKELYSWAHYAFRQRLLMKATEFGVTVHEVDEAYTSKTCGKCGVLNNKLGGAKVFQCGHCSFVADRDENGARNILLRNLSLVSAARLLV